MDREYAMRMVVFEYLLPMQRAARMHLVHRSLLETEIMLSLLQHMTTDNIVRQSMLLLSDRLLSTHGYATSFRIPRHQRIQYRYTSQPVRQRRTVDAIVHCDDYGVSHQPYVRAADPAWGVMV